MGIGSRSKERRENWIFVLIIAFVLYGSTAVFSPSFRSVENIRNLIVQLTPLMLVTLGQSLVIFTGGIDLSVGSMISLSTVIAATLFMKLGLIPGIIIILCIAVLFGSINGWLISKLKINPFIMTLSSMVIAQGIALYILPGPGGKIPAFFVRFTFGVEFLGIPIYSWIALFFFLIISFIIYKSKFGLQIFALGGNKEASYLAGIPVQWVTMGVYICSSLLAAIAGILISTRIACGDPLVGQIFSLDSVGASVVGGASLAGGRGGALGALGGVIILGSISNILNMLSINPYWQFLLKSMIIITAIALAIRFEHLASNDSVDHA
jgi:ribose transport system permease protein